jgi:hypothetical protein
LNRAWGVVAYNSPVRGTRTAVRSTCTLDKTGTKKKKKKKKRRQNKIGYPFVNSPPHASHPHPSRANGLLRHPFCSGRGFQSLRGGSSSPEVHRTVPRRCARMCAFGPDLPVHVHVLPRARIACMRARARESVRGGLHGRLCDAPPLPLPSQQNRSETHRVRATSQHADGHPGKELCPRFADAKAHEVGTFARVAGSRCSFTHGDGLWALDGHIWPVTHPATSAPLPCHFRSTSTPEKSTSFLKIHFRTTLLDDSDTSTPFPHYLFTR